MLRNLVHASCLILLILAVGCQYQPPAHVVTATMAADAAPAPLAQANAAPDLQEQNDQASDPPQQVDAQAADEDDEVAAEDVAAEDVAATDEEAKDVPDKETKQGVVKAYFLSTGEHPIAVRTEEWKSELRVEEAVAHGASVEQGDVIIQFRSRKLDQAVEDQQHSVTTARLALEKAHLELENLRKSKRLAMTDADRAEQYATDDLKRFVTTELDQRKESLEFSHKSAENYLAYEEEELKQLTKMYEADDLTEETEEIVLRRTRDDVERSRRRLLVNRQGMEKSFEVELPRAQERLENALKKAAIEREAVHSMAEAELAEKEVGVEELTRKLHRAEERLARLNADRQWLTMKAPISGIAYHGKQRFGKWTDPSQMANSLRPGGICKPHQVLLTIVEPDVGQVVGTMDEANLARVTKQRTGKLVISAYPELECEAAVVEISPVPVADGKFLVTMQPRLPDDVELLVPGMTCEVTFQAQEEE